jgi:LCP family protein required for cell wall assembly
MSNELDDQPAIWHWMVWLCSQGQLKKIHRLGLLALVILISFSFSATLAKVIASTSRNRAPAHAAKIVSSLGKLPFTLDHPINILILGIDQSGQFQSGDVTTEATLAGNSDTVLLVRLQPDTRQINVLSIPRDTRVEIPGYGMDKINAANAIGGSALATQVVSQSFGGVNIDRYLRLNTEGLIHLVDALGGVEINVPKEMNYADETQNLHIAFAAGRQRLNGQQLEEYVRFRHDELADLGRVQRQQDVLKAVLTELLKPETVAKLPNILQIAQTHLDTNLSVSDLLTVCYFLDHADLHQVNLIALPGRFSSKGEYRLSYWIEDPQATAAILARYFDIANSDLPATQPASADAISIAVVNTTNRPELAEAVVAFLRDRGFSQAYVNDQVMNASPGSEGTTLVIAQRGNPDAAALVQAAIEVGQVQVASTGDLTSDVTLIVSTDLATKLFP